jgi:hypothetical protein
MSSPEIQRDEIQRRVLQQGNDVAALYDLLEGVDDKIDTLDDKVGAGFARLDSKIDVKVARLDAKIDTLDARLSGKLDAILQRLGG